MKQTYNEPYLAVAIYGGGGRGACAQTATPRRCRRGASATRVIVIVMVLISTIVVTMTVQLILVRVLVIMQTITMVVIIIWIIVGVPRAAPALGVARVARPTIFICILYCSLLYNVLYLVSCYELLCYGYTMLFIISIYTYTYIYIYIYYIRLSLALARTPVEAPDLPELVATATYHVIMHRKPKYKYNSIHLV